MNPKLRGHIEYYFNEIVSKFNDIPGDYVELGFGKGNSAEMIIRGMKDGRFRKRTMWLFDSFEGFPEPTEEDESPRKPKKGQWNVPIGLARRLRAKHPEIDIRIVKGFFSDTVPYSYDSSEGIGVLNLDCDLYESYKDGFKLRPLVNPGGLIMFDEYEEERWPGATLAINECFEKDSLNFWKPESQHPKCYYIQPS